MEMKTMSGYTLYCTESQTKKALKMGAPIEENEYPCDTPTMWEGWYPNEKEYKIPTAEQMIGWLEDFGLFIEPIIIYREQSKMFAFNLSWDIDSQIECVLNRISGDMPEFDTYIEATLAAIDAALDYLSNK